jgi:hypothetical protein
MRCILNEIYEMEVCNRNSFNALLQYKLDWDQVLFVFRIKNLELIFVYLQV